MDLKLAHFLTSTFCNSTTQTISSKGAGRG